MSDNKTYDKIIEIAIHTFAEKGYAGTSMREIAEELNMTKAALYYHFPGKEEIFSACIHNGIEKITCNLETLSLKEGIVWDKIKFLIHGMCTFSEKNSDTFNFFRKVMSKNFDANIDMKILETYFKRIKIANVKIVEDGIENGEIRNDIPVNLLVSALTGMIHYSSGPKMRMMADIASSPEEQAENLITLLKEGFTKK